MTRSLLITLSATTFTARVEAKSPTTIAWLSDRLPFEGSAQHARWSGEAAWVKLGASPDVPFENATAYPAPGQLLLYPSGPSEPEILLPYGPCAFACRAGPLAGNHFATILGGLADLRSIGEALLLTGAQPLRIAWGPD
jgi:hypothetical protein